MATYPYWQKAGRVFVNRFPNDPLGSRTIEAIPASAPSGYYRVTLTVICRTGATAGTWTITAGCTSKDGIAASVALGNMASSTPGAITSSAARMYEFGTGNPFTFTCTATGITGSPSFDISSVAEFVAPVP